MDEKLKLPLREDIRFELEDLRQVMAVLLGENGCPWDKEQTLASLRQYLIEECYEAVEAINKKDDKGLCEELGDVLFQVMFQSVLAEQAGKFALEDVIDGICRKMISRHTHIFGSVDKADSPEEVEKLWQINKDKEKKKTAPAEKFKSVPKELPALMRSQKIIAKAEKFSDKEPDIQKLLEEASERLKTLQDMNFSEKQRTQEEIGNLLFGISQISAYLQINAEFALTNATETFINRFEYINDASIY